MHCDSQSIAHEEQDVDPFAAQKLESFRTAGAAVYTLASSLDDLVRQEQPNTTKEELHATFLHFVQAELWGNASGDLSLFAGLSSADIDALQRTDAGDRSHRIIVNDLAASWDHLSSLRGARIDIVLDNAGFELYTDLCFADWLVSCTPFCKQVVFHPKAVRPSLSCLSVSGSPLKQIPWFVSDVTPPGLLLSASLLLCIDRRRRLRKPVDRSDLRRLLHFDPATCSSRGCLQNYTPLARSSIKRILLPRIRTPLLDRSQSILRIGYRSTRAVRRSAARQAGHLQRRSQLPQVDERFDLEAGNDIRDGTRYPLPSFYVS